MNTLNADPYTMEVRLCDDAGKVSNTPVEPGSPGTAFDAGLTYLKLHNNLRARNANPDARRPVEEEGWQCTGHAHLGCEHIRCTNPIHDGPKAGTLSVGGVVAGNVIAVNAVGDWTHPNFEWPLPPVTKLKAALAGYDAQYGVRGIGEQHPELPQGCVDRVEALVREARAVVEAA